MMDWVHLVVNSIWILGLSVILAAFGYNDWLVREAGGRRRDLFRKRSWRLPSAAGMALFCLALGLGRHVSWWGRALWGVLAFSFLAQLVGWFRSGRGLARADSPRHTRP